MINNISQDKTSFQYFYYVKIKIRLLRAILTKVFSSELIIFWV